MLRPRLCCLLLLGFLLLAGCRGPVGPGVVKVGPDGFIAWADARQLILSGGVVSVAQNHDRVVSLNLKDGTTYKTREDRLDEVIHFIEDHGLQDKISIATE
jgi:hypothetical protein